MSSDLTLRCPVCRATQTIRDQCRRCQADLSLVARAHRRVAYLMAERERARAAGDRWREQSLLQELDQLVPRGEHTSDRS
jgi:primosomal protein N'